MRIRYVIDEQNIHTHVQSFSRDINSHSPFTLRSSLCVVNFESMAIHVVCACVETSGENRLIDDYGRLMLLLCEECMCVARTYIDECSCFFY